MFFISEALAQASDVADVQPPSPAVNFLPLVIIFIIFYFLLIRPQQKKIKEHNEMVDALGKGDEVVTGGGIVGKIVKSDGEIVHVEISSGVVVQVLRNTISSNNSSKKASK